MKRIFGSSWKTSLIGFLSAIALIVQDYFERGITDIYRIIMAILVYLLGRFAADNSKKHQ